MGFLDRLFGKKENKDNTPENKDFEIFKFDGVRAQRIGKLAYAEKCFLKALEIKEEFETLFYLSSLYIQNAMDDKALETIDRMIKAEPLVTSSYLTAAQLLLRNEDKEKALGYAQRAAEINATDPDILYVLARTENANGMPQQAIAHISEAIQAKPDFEEAMLLRADILSHEGQTEDALKDIEQILCQDSENENAIYMKAKITFKQGLPEEAIKLFEEIIQLNPFNNDAHIAKAKVLKETAPEEAIKSIEESLDMVPECAALYALRAEANRMLGNTSLAEQDEQKARELEEAAPDSNLKDKKEDSEFDSITGIFK